MWCLQTIKQINEVSAVVKRQGGSYQDVYPLCGITGVIPVRKPMADLKKEYEFENEKESEQEVK